MCPVFFLQAEDGIRDLVRSRGLGDVYKRQHQMYLSFLQMRGNRHIPATPVLDFPNKSPMRTKAVSYTHLTLPTIYSV